MCHGEWRSKGNVEKLALSFTMWVPGFGFMLSGLGMYIILPSHWSFVN